MNRCTSTARCTVNSTICTTLDSTGTFDSIVPNYSSKEAKSVWRLALKLDFHGANENCIASLKWSLANASSWLIFYLPLFSGSLAVAWIPHRINWSRLGCGNRSPKTFWRMWQAGTRETVALLFQRKEFARWLVRRLIFAIVSRINGGCACQGNEECQGCWLEDAISGWEMDRVVRFINQGARLACRLATSFVDY